MAIRNLTELRAAADPEYKALSDRDLVEAYSSKAGIPFADAADFFGIRGRGTLREMGGQALAGLTVDVPRMAGQALKYFADDDSATYRFGQGLVEGAERRDMTAQPDLRGRGLFSESMVLGSRALAPTLSTVAAGVGTSLVAGPVAGAGVTGALSAGLFGGSGGQESYERVLAETGDVQAATSAGRGSAAVQGLGEAAANIVGGALIKPFVQGAAKGGMKGVVNRFTNPRVYRDFGKALGINYATQISTEVGQDVGTSLIEQRYGAAPEDLGSIAASSAKASFGMTTLLGGFGLGTAMSRKRDADRMKLALEGDPSIPAAEQMLAVARVRQEAETAGVAPERASAWAIGQLRRIDNAVNKPTEKLELAASDFLAAETALESMDESAPGYQDLIDKQMEARTRFIEQGDKPSDFTAIDKATGERRVLTFAELNALGNKMTVPWVADAEVPAQQVGLQDTEVDLTVKPESIESAEGYLSAITRFERLRAKQEAEAAQAAPGVVAPVVQAAEQETDLTTTTPVVIPPLEAVDIGKLPAREPATTRGKKAAAASKKTPAQEVPIEETTLDNTPPYENDADAKTDAEEIAAVLDALEQEENAQPLKAEVTGGAIPMSTGRPSLPRQVFTAIRNAVLSGRKQRVYKPGTRIEDTEMTKQYAGKITEIASAVREFATAFGTTMGQAANATRTATATFTNKMTERDTRVQAAYERLTKVVGNPRDIDAIVRMVKDRVQKRALRQQDQTQANNYLEIDANLSQGWQAVRGGVYDSGAVDTAFVRSGETRESKERRERNQIIENLTGETTPTPLQEAATAGYAISRNVKAGQEIDKGIFALMNRLIDSGTRYEGVLARALKTAFTNMGDKAPAVEFDDKGPRYSPKENKIYLGKRSSPEVQLHEALHGALQWFVYNNPKDATVVDLMQLVEQVVGYADNLSGPALEVQQVIAKLYKDGKQLDAVLELISYTNTHTEFRRALSKLQANENLAPKTFMESVNKLWAKMKELANALIGGGNSVADNVMRRSFELLEKAATAEVNLSVGALGQELTATVTGGSIRATPSVNMRRMAKLLGPQLYGDMKDIGLVTIKEVFQNSFDALKGMLDRGQQIDAKISIDLDPDARTITITDNGTGMTPQTINEAFLVLAGTEKDTERASGGLGIAKMLFLFGNESLSLRTVRDGVESTMFTTGAQMMEAFSDPTAAPDINFDKTDAPSGTTITIKIPETYWDSDTDADLPVEFPDDYEARNLVDRSPLLEDVEVRVNGRVRPIGKNFDASDFTVLTVVPFSWGKLRVMVAETEYPRYRNVTVLSNGLYQFEHDSIKKNPADPYSGSAPYTFFFNVEPTVKADAASYPIGLNRKAFKASAASDVAVLMKYIAVLYANKQDAEGSKSFGTLQQVSEDGTQSSDLDLQIPDAKVGSVLAIDKNDVVEVRDGRLYVNNREVPELTKEKMKEMRRDPAQFRVDQSLLDPEKLIIHDNVVFNDQPYLQAAAEAVGEQALNAYLRGVGSAFKFLRDAVVRIGGSGYESLSQVPVGVSIDVEYYGVNTAIPFQAMMINPTIVRGNDPAKVARTMVGTMIHEAAHHTEKNHSETGFIPEMQRLFVELGMSGDMQQAIDQLQAVLDEHAEVFSYFKRTYDNESENLKPKGVRLQGDAQSTDDSGAGGNELGSGQGGGRGASNTSGATQSSRTGGNAGNSAGVRGAAAPSNTNGAPGNRSGVAPQTTAGVAPAGITAPDLRQFNNSAMPSILSTQFIFEALAFDKQAARVKKAGADIAAKIRKDFPGIEMRMAKLYSRFSVPAAVNEFMDTFKNQRNIPYMLMEHVAHRLERSPIATRQAFANYLDGDTTALNGIKDSEDLQILGTAVMNHMQNMIAYLPKPTRAYFENKSRKFTDKLIYVESAKNVTPHTFTGVNVSELLRLRSRLEPAITWESSWINKDSNGDPILTDSFYQVVGPDKLDPNGKIVHQGFMSANKFEANGVPLGMTVDTTRVWRIDSKSKDGFKFSSSMTAEQANKELDGTRFTNALRNTMAALAANAASAQYLNNMLLLGRQNLTPEQVKKGTDPDATATVFDSVEQIEKVLGIKPTKILDASTAEAEVSRVRDRYRVSGTWVRLPSTYGPLKGKLVPGPVYTAMLDMVDRQPLTNMLEYQQMLSFWKKTKTTMNPGTHVTNTLTNFTLMYMHDISFRQLGAAAKVYARFHTSPGSLSQDERKLMVSFMESGAMLGDLSTAEIKRDLYNAMLSADDTGGGIVDKLKTLTGYEQSKAKLIADKVGAKLVKADEVSAALYSAEDNIFRFALFLKTAAELQAQRGEATASAKTTMDAGKRARSGYVDYDIDSVYIRTLRQSVLPFVSFTYGIIPVLGRIALEKPWKIANVLTAFYITGAMMQGLVDDDDEETRKKMPEYIRNRMFGIGPYMHMRLPFGGSEDPVYMRIGDYFPLAGSGGGLPNGFMGQSWVPMGLNPSNPLLTLAVAFLGGVDVYTGKPIHEVTDTDFQKMANAAKSAYGVFSPPVVGPSNLQNMKDVVTGKTGITGVTESPAVFARAFLGLRLYQNNLQEAEAIRGVIVDGVRRDFQMAMSRAKRQEAQSGSPDYEALDKELQKLYERMQKAIDEARGDTSE